jgi:amidohydrolase
MTDYVAEAKEIERDLIAWRRDLHSHPELGFAEVRTAGIIVRHLSELGLKVQTGVGRTGVVGLLEGTSPLSPKGTGGTEGGPVVMLRFDMDALPITEENVTDYVSQTPGVMHACGHDGHVAIGLGVATLLARHRSELSGSVKFVFQPAEEGLGGAMEMIRDGALQSPRPKVALGLHIFSLLPLGQVAAGEGPVMAAAERFHCIVTGRGGHGAMPHQTVDAVVVAAHIVTALQTVVSRNVDPAEPAVVSVGSLHAGSAFNIIAEQAELWGTIRTFDEAARQMVLRRVREVVEGIARTLGALAQLEIEELTIAVVNDVAASARVREAAARVVGAEHVSAQQRWMASEDMSYFLREVGGCFFFLGSARHSSEFPHHNSRFDFDEGVLPQGVAILCETAASYLREV